MKVLEIFNTDLDPNSTLWWSQEKIDKINYNFALMINGGPNGPVGADGIDGIIGTTGGSGSTGPNGFAGPQGPQGLAGDRNWKSAISAGRISIFPRDKAEDPLINSYAPPSIKIGESVGSSTATSPTNTSDESIIKPGVVKVNSLDANSGGGNISRKNIKLTYNQLAYTTISYDTLTSPAGKGLNIVTDDGTGTQLPIKFNSEYVDIIGETTSLTASAKLSIKSSKIELETTNLLGGISFNLSSGGTAKFKGKTFLEKGAGPNKVLRTADSVGTLQWKDITEVFTIFPIGTILQIPQSDYNNINFYTTYTEDVTTVNNTLTGLIDIRLRTGAGRETSKWKGWYVCNGKTWTGGTAATQASYVFPYSKTPNLNNIKYQLSLPTPDLGLTDVDCPGCGGLNNLDGDWGLEGYNKSRQTYILGSQRHGVNITYSSVDARFDLSTPGPDESGNMRFATDSAVYDRAHFSAIASNTFSSMKSESGSHKNRDGESGISIVYLGKIDLYWYHETQNNW